MRVALRDQRRPFPGERALLLEEAVERRGLRVVTPAVIAGDLAGPGAHPAEQLPLHGPEALEDRVGVQRLKLVPDGDPAQRVAEEHRLAGDLRVVVGARVPDPAVEEHHVTRCYLDLDGALGRWPLDVTAWGGRAPGT